MSSSPIERIAHFADLRVGVLGEAMLDCYLDGTAARLCREAPVPVVDVVSRIDAPGGAANTAANARALGASVTFLSVVGDDPEGAALLRALRERDVPTATLLTQHGRRTLAKHRLVAEGQLLVRYDHGSTAAIAPEIERQLMERLADLYRGWNAVVVSDYGYGLLSPRLIQTLARMQAQAPSVLVVDSKRLPLYREVGASAVKPNYAEALALLGLATTGASAGRADVVAGNAERLLEATGAQVVAVTLDAEGAFVVERGRPAYRTYARPTSHARAAGAGDTFAAALALALAAGMDTPAAAELASAAAAIVVGRGGTAVCSAAELREHLAGADKVLRGLEHLAARVEFYRQQRRRIVFTNGCFDILHRGHVTFLNRAKALGDVLIVGLNADEGVRRLKGSGRPINSLEDRLQVLSALSSVDHLVPFDEDTPVELIRAIRPDVFVKGGDYTRERLPEAPLVEALGGGVHLLPLLMDRSTSGIIQRIRAVQRPPRGLVSES